MSVSDYQRHRVFQWFEGQMGPERAATLMDLLPPVGWADVATKRDVDHLGSSVRAEIQLLRADFTAQLHNELRKQTLAMVTLLTAIMGIFATVSALF